MKHSIYSITAALMLLCGCQDYLGIKPRGYDVAYKVEHYEGLIYGTEMFMLDEVFPYMCFEITTDADGFANSYSIIGSDITNAYLWKADIFRPDENCGEWNNPASYMYSLNIIINEVLDASDGTEEERQAIRAEARTLRAYMTFIMTQFFSKPYDPATADHDLCVPIITEASTVGQKYPRRTVREVYDFIISEMEESVPMLPERVEHPNRAFRVTGYAMLGKVYWMMGDYSKAEDCLAKAMALLPDSGMGLMDYGTIVSNGEITYPIDDLLNPELLYNYETMTHIWSAMYPSYYGMPLFTIKSDVLKKYYTKGDYRLCFISGMKSSKTAFSHFDGKDIYHLNLSNFITNIGIKVPDLYLMYGECLARNKRYGDARRILEELRCTRMDSASAVVTAADGEELVKFAVDERMREYLGYGNTWFDTRRLWHDPLFQDMKEMYYHTDGEQTYALTEDRLVMRIPPQVMEWHPEYVDND